MWDCHVHLQLVASIEDWGQNFPPTYHAVSVASLPQEWETLAQLAEQFPNQIIPVFGVHPQQAALCDDSCMSLLEKYLQRFQNAWCGETGLDTRFPQKALQKEAFTRQAQLALQYQRPLMIHNVGRSGAIANILREVGYTPKTPPIIWHRFTGNHSQAQDYLKLFQVYFSLHRESLERSESIQALAAIPVERVLMETDGDARLGQGLQPSERIHQLWLAAHEMAKATQQWPIVENLERIGFGPLKPGSADASSD